MHKIISIDPLFAEIAPEYKLIYIEADLENSATSDAIRSLRDETSNEISRRYEISQVNKRPEVVATRTVYKKLGKEPNRYRPSQEQLMRRVVNGAGLYEINTLVDLGNIFSIKTGWAIGIFDRDKIEGDILKIGVGKKDEPYEAIGRGMLNIENLPIVRDKIGGIGTPTSDNERTKVSLQTSRISATIHVFDSKFSNCEEVGNLFISYICEFCDAKNVEIKFISCQNPNI